MKRILVALAIMLVAVGAAAQDTLHANHPFSNYLSNYWWDFKDGDSVFCNLSSNYPSNAYKGLVMYNPDTLPIYGLAVGVLLYPADEQVISDPLNGWTVLPGDTSLDNTYMDFVIMQVDSYSFSVYAASAPLRLHIKYEPVSYYLDNRLIMNVQYQPDPCEPFPVYELYFDSAVTVFDKFYIGGRNHSDTGIAPVQNIYPHIRVAGWLNPVGGVARHFVINWQHTDPYPGYPQHRNGKNITTYYGNGSSPSLHPIPTRRATCPTTALRCSGPCGSAMWLCSPTPPPTRRRCCQAWG